MNILQVLESRGLLQDVSDREGLAKLPPGTPFYIGFDPSAPSLQLGNLVGLIVAMHLGRAGLAPIILFGGATGSIGDPSGKSAERQLLDIETTERNLEKQKRQAERMLAKGGLKATFVNNMDWTRDVRLLEFLRDIGKHFTVNYMIAKDVVKSRLDGEGISYTEFSYMLLQSFDFLHLYQQHKCKLQVGGSDQWGNITAGLELIRRKLRGEAFALSFPLILDGQGRKFGKSESGAIWLDPAMTSPYRLHQYLLNVEDDLAIRYLRIFTFLDHSQIADIEASLASAPQERRAQHALADSVCTLVHGEEATADARRCAEVLFGGSLEGLSETQLQDIFADAPSSTMPRQKFEQSSVLDLFCDSNLAKSRGEGKKLIASGGAYINNTRLSDPTQRSIDLTGTNANLVVLRSGKKNYHLLKIE